MTHQPKTRRPESLEAKTRKLLRRYNLRARKSLGQHFLIEEAALNLVVSAAEIIPSDIVLEIGPGLGIMTGELAKRAGWVIAIELDDSLAAILKESLSAYGNITVVNEDVLKIDPGKLLKQQKIQATSENKSGYKVVANLPYYITSPAIRHFLEASAKPESMVLMVQKEVAEEITAKPGKMSLLSISVQLYGEAQIVGYVPAESFYPAPEVDSAIIKIILYPRPAVDVPDIDDFFKLVRAGFTASRKQLANSLAKGLDISKHEAVELIEQANINPQRRAETLTLEEWALLLRIYKQSGK